MTHHFLALATVAIVLGAAPSHAVDGGGPIYTCEENNQLIADKYSCTRYHMCRQLDQNDDFTTDIAICPSDKVFDMVISECVDYETGFLQDPAGCSTFYGCHPTRETSEGFLRRHYTCPGDLRFNPEEKYCTFKTNVTDDLCNSRDPEQRIIGDVNRIRNNNGFIRSETRPSSGLVRTSKPASVTSHVPPSPPKRSGLVPNPVPESNLDRIAQVISGQLLSLQGREKVKQKDKKEDLKAKEAKEVKEAKKKDKKE